MCQQNFKGVLNMAQQIFEDTQNMRQQIFKGTQNMRQHYFACQQVLQNRPIKCTRYRTSFIMVTEKLKSTHWSESFLLYSMIRFRISGVVKCSLRRFPVISIYFLSISFQITCWHIFGLKFLKKNTSSWKDGKSRQCFYEIQKLGRTYFEAPEFPKHSVAKPSK